MSDTFQISATTRTLLGKADMRRMRREGHLPGVVYGGGKDPVSLTAVHKDVMHSLANEAFAASVLTLNLDGVEEQVVLKDVQRHPYKPVLLHMDLLRVSQTTKLSMTVALHFINEDTAPGVKVSGGQVSHNMTEVDIICLPANLPEFISVDLGALEEGQSIHLSDLVLPEGVEIPALALGSDHDMPVASIHKARGMDENEASEEAAGDDAAEDASDES